MEAKTEKYVVTASALGAVGTAGAAALSSLCCAGPAVLAVLGTSGAVAAASLAPYRLALLGGAFGILGLAFWQSHRPVAVGAACSVRTGRPVRAILWVSLVATVVAAILPYWLE
jgi:mercuric ion transport protein